MNIRLLYVDHWYHSGHSPVAFQILNAWSSCSFLLSSCRSNWERTHCEKLGNFIANSWVSSHNDTNFFLIKPNHSPSYICIYRWFQWRRSRNFISVVKCVKCAGLSAPITWHALFSKRRFADIRGRMLSDDSLRSRRLNPSAESTLRFFFQYSVF